MKKTGSGGEWLTTGEAAERIGMSRQAVARAIAAGKLAYQKVGEFYLIRRDVAEAYQRRKKNSK